MKLCVDKENKSVITIKNDSESEIFIDTVDSQKLLFDGVEKNVEISLEKGRFVVLMLKYVDSFICLNLYEKIVQDEKIPLGILEIGKNTQSGDLGICNFYKHDEGFAKYKCVDQGQDFCTLIFHN